MTEFSGVMFQKHHLRENEEIRESRICPRRRYLSTREVIGESATLYQTAQESTDDHNL